MKAKIIVEIDDYGGVPVDLKGSLNQMAMFHVLMSLSKVFEKCLNPQTSIHGFAQDEKGRKVISEGIVSEQFSKEVAFSVAEKEERKRCYNLSRWCDCNNPKTRNIASNRCLKCGKIIRRMP